MNKDKEIVVTQEVIEPEILDENGRPIGAEPRQAPHGQLPPHVHIFGGVFAVAFSFIMILVMAVVTLFIVLPLMILGKILGFQVRSFKR